MCIRGLSAASFILNTSRNHSTLIRCSPRLCGPHKRGEQRMSVEWLRLVFRMKLAADKPRMHIARQLDHLDKLAVRRNTTEHQTFLFQTRTILRIELVTMTMTLA